ncbi:MAG: phosphatidate cytidylyltransferase, partial [Alphaproteobacteria bacterium]
MLHGIGPRVASALVLASAVVALAYAGGVGFNLLIVAAAALMGHEWSRLCNDGAVATGAAVIAGAAVPVAIAAVVEPHVALIAEAEVALIAVAAAPVPVFAVALIAVAAAAVLVFAGAWATGARRLWSAAGVVYISIPCIALVWLRAAPTLGLETIFWLFAVVWATDTG